MVIVTLLLGLLLVCFVSYCRLLWSLSVVGVGCCGYSIVGCCGLSLWLLLGVVISIVIFGCCGYCICLFVCNVLLVVAVMCCWLLL